MKIFFVINSLLLTILVLPSASFAGWRKVSESMDGSVFYVDPSTIKKSGSSIYFWQLNDYAEPDDRGEMSSKIYKQLECFLNQYQSLKYASYQLSMGQGAAKVWTAHDQSWKSVDPEDIMSDVAEFVCR